MFFKNFVDDSPSGVKRNEDSAYTPGSGESDWQ